MKAKGWCLHYTRLLVMGGGTGCICGGRKPRFQCNKGTHDFSASDAKSHYNAWAVSIGENPV